MSDPKDNSFFRKVVKFVANPATDWKEIDAPHAEPREQEFAKSELKAMIERKRRNDFVRKREFDMLRKVRREGLSAEQLAALGGSSKLDDSESRTPDAYRRGGGVKAKIDAIEQQMVGDGSAGLRRPATANIAGNPGGPGAAGSRDFFTSPTKPTGIGSPGGGPAAMPSVLPSVLPSTFPAAAPRGGARMGSARTAPVLTEVVPDETLAVARAQAVDADSALHGLDLGTDLVEPPHERELPHDPELDEAVIAFANADFDACELALTALVSAHGPRGRHPQTWLVLFDLFRAVGRQDKFDALAVDYQHQFGWAAPRWFSMPQLAAEAAAEQRPSARAPAAEAALADIGWAAPAHLDREAVSRLAGRALQMTTPWVLDWSAMRSVDAEASARLTDLFRGWALQPLEMRWIGGETFFNVLRDAAPAGVRDVDPALWRLRLEGLRLVDRASAFDEAAIDYCVTYEVSPPSWERAACKVRVASGNSSPAGLDVRSMGDVTSSFTDGQGHDADPALAHCELSGQLAGDITTLLHQVGGQLGSATGVQVSCARLIRVDFIAAGDLLNWVLGRKGEGREVVFDDANRLVALFFGAMGINEHARVRVRAA
jgi:hypothetical protein